MSLTQPKETKEPKSKFLMGLAPTNAVSYGEDKRFIFTTEEIKRMDNAVLRRLASECDNPQIKGKGCNHYELTEYFLGQTCLPDFKEYE